MTELAFCFEKEFAGQPQSDTSSLLDVEYVELGHTIVRFSVPPGQYEFSLHGWHSTGCSLSSVIVASP